MDKILWISRGNSAQAWYRCALPANSLDQDWVGYVSGPPGLGGVMITGNIVNEPVIEDYSNIIVQLARGEIWISAIKYWQEQGIKVFYEIDDYIHGVNRIKDHRFRAAFNKKAIKEYEEAMRACNGIICSTPFLAEQYKKFNNNVHVCHNYIDTSRYNIERIDNGDKVVIGWSGGTGHLQAMKTWFSQVFDSVATYDRVRFVSCGAQYADEISAVYPYKAISVPWTTIENYPYVLAAFDISIAPAHDSKYFKSKSDLRWLEASAVGIPVIANPITYPYVEDEVTGLLATTGEEFEYQLDRLIADKDLREKLGNNAKEFVNYNRDIRGGCQAWVEIIEH
jgi:rhamnosyltransferase